MTISKLTILGIQLPATVLLSILTFGLCFSTSDRAYASDTCKNARIEIINGTPDKVKLTKFEYYDYDKKKYRTENMFGTNGSDIIKQKDTMPYLRDLEQIGDDKTKFRVTYQHQLVVGLFAAPIPQVGQEFTCQNNGGPYRIILTK